MSTLPQSEPIIRVGLVHDVEQIAILLKGEYRDSQGESFPPGSYHFTARENGFLMTGERSGTFGEIKLSPLCEEARFCLEATIGIDFHWQQKETQVFADGLELLARPGNRLTVVNSVRLESYLTSVICSEMSTTSPPDLARAHATISRSWLLAQLSAQNLPTSPENQRPGELIRWYGREAHQDFDVCADDHCQRYQGAGKIENPTAFEAVRDTRGLLLTCEGQVCDARYSKCCGGLTEEFKAAWGDVDVPYLTVLFDGPPTAKAPTSVSEETAFQQFLNDPPTAFCNCQDPAILQQILPKFDQKTSDFFRWTQRLEATEAGDLVHKKLGLDLGRILKLEPLARARSGRLVLLKIVGEKGEIRVGKELEIRRALSPTHLYSSAFVVETEGPSERPVAFVLKGAGWGHGVGLCQIGAAVMAVQGYSYQEILRHYYPHTQLTKSYP